jgi:hypothetical protein
VGHLTVGGNVTARLGAGQDSLWVAPPPAGVNTIGGNLTFVGGTGPDWVMLDGTTVGKDLNVAFGDGPGVQLVRVGTDSTVGVQVHGSVKVTGSAAENEVTLRRLLVGHGLTVATRGGDDTIALDDVDVFGPTRIDLGAGNDQVNVEMDPADLAGNLNNDSTFGGKFTLLGRDGADLVFLSDDGDPTTLARFGGRVVLLGGAGPVSLESGGNEFLLTGNVEDFETGDPVP